MRGTNLEAYRGISGTVILPAMAIHMAMRLAAHGLQGWRPDLYGPNLEREIYFWGAIVVALAGFLLCLAVAMDYRRTSFLRWAWVLFSGDALMSLFRFSAELAKGEQAASARNVLVSIGLLCLLAGIFVTWSGLYRMHVLFTVKRSDIIAVCLMALFGVITLVLTANLEGVVVRLIPIAMIFVGAIGSFLLLRFSGQMQGGQISAVIRVLVAYLAVRCGINFLIALGATREGLAGWLFLILQTAMPWILTLAAGLRYDVNLRAVRTTREYQALAAAAPSKAAML